ncbi:MAG: DUF4990 domain-containing protein [Lachnospiraceae bacterium]|nr:DUF4990 domain-containing protein [Lachnospiraceae bacterium]
MRISLGKFNFTKLIAALAFLFAIIFFADLTAYAADWYVSPSGSDSNSGTYSSPFASLNKAEAAASSGDTVYIMGGTYKNFTVEASDSNYNYVHQFTKSNITYRAYTSKNVPVFDFSGTSTSKRVAAFHVKSGVTGVTFLCFKVTNVPVGSQKQSECFRIEGNATLNQITCYNSNANGFYFCNNGTGNVIKCDAYNLYTSNSTSNSNTDGFGAHGKGVTFTQCRAWACGDDGFDCITSKGANTFDTCWAYNMNKGGDSNGFKIGGYGTGTVPSTVPVHTVKYCLAANNGSNGFYANHQPGQAANWTYNTAYGNKGANYNMLERVSPTDSTDIAGTREFLRCNISYNGAIKNIGSGSKVGNCSWNSSFNCTADDFVSLDASQMTKSRGSNGVLPTITFMHLKSGSDLQGMGCF